MPTVAVIGSLNVDRSVSVPHFPSRGETVLGGDLRIDNGGKGANQAVAAARLDAQVAMIGCIGSDSDGTRLLEALVAETVDVEHIAVTDLPSGAAFISVDHTGENTIVVAPGANTQLNDGIIQSGANRLANADVVLAQLEVPETAVALGRELTRGRFVLNPAPATAGVGDWWRGVDVLVPNRGELATLTGLPATTMDETVAAARSVDVSLVVVTLGGDGALVVENGVTTHIAASVVDVVDTTAAGDSFCGALAVGLAEGLGAVEAAAFATRCAAWAVGRRGAQSSLPRRQDIV